MSQKGENSVKVCLHSIKVCNADFPLFNLTNLAKSGFFIKCVTKLRDYCIEYLDSL